MGKYDRDGDFRVHLHQPGKTFVCDSRVYAGDRRLCPLHTLAPDMLKELKRLLVKIEESDHDAPLARFLELHEVVPRITALIADVEKP